MPTSLAARSPPPSRMHRRGAARSLAFLLFACAAIAAIPPPASAADAPATGRIPTVTRLVKRFLDLEDGLAAAARSGDRATVEKMLAEDFEMRVASAPGNPTPRAEWIAEVIARPGPAGRIEQMAVHDYGDVAVVSFLQAAAAGAKRDPARDIATVDVWRKSGESWLLAARYAGPAGARTFVVPGASREEPIPKKY